MIKEQTELAAWLTAGRIMESRNGVPYVLLGNEGSSRKVSVCYFYSTRVFRVFAPHPCDKGTQVKYTFSDPKLAAACAKRLHKCGSEAYALWIADGGSEEGLAESVEKWKAKRMVSAQAVAWRRDVIKATASDVATGLAEVCPGTTQAKGKEKRK